MEKPALILYRVFFELRIENVKWIIMITPYIRIICISVSHTNNANHNYPFSIFNSQFENFPFSIRKLSILNFRLHSSPFTSFPFIQSIWPYSVSSEVQCSLTGVMRLSFGHDSVFHTA